jgi:hypothetical protein
MGQSQVFDILDSITLILHFWSDRPAILDCSPFRITPQSEVANFCDTRYDLTDEGLPSANTRQHKERR